MLSEPLADDLTRRQALRLAPPFHCVGKPPTRPPLPDGRPPFIGHGAVGERMVQAICGRLRTSHRLRTFVASITRHHLALGFLVHERPLSRRDVYGYLTTCQPVEVEVTAFSCADRLATRGRRADAAIAAHLELARELMADALAWRAHGPPKPPLRGDELAEALAMDRGPELGALLRELEAASYAGEITAREDALALARRLRDAPRG